ncbi:MAG TPA: LysR substrate-binding domain-containing protein, partial [Aromatoleum sp.]|uniref:LysR substrate-binding domain-containing protein n=1 Tax=Aromatoleum sp. TaxID=2307007 RepID=UPI002B474BA0
EKLHRVQSNVTTRIRQLEENLGVELFVREGRRLMVSPPGRVLLDYADRLLALAEEARGAVSDGRPRGRLRFGSMESTAAARLPALLARFHTEYPDVQLELRTGATGTLIAEVIDGQLDCALVSGPVHDPRLLSVPAFDEELVVVAPACHAPIRSPRDLKARTLLTFEPGCAYRQRLQAWLAADGVVAERVVELSSYHAMIGCAASGMGIAFVPRSLLACLPVDGSVSIHELDAALAHVVTVLIHRVGQPAPSVGVLAGMLQSSRDAALHSE